MVDMWFLWSKVLKYIVSINGSCAVTLLKNTKICLIQWLLRGCYGLEYLNSFDSMVIMQLVSSKVTRSIYFYCCYVVATVNSTKNISINVSYAIQWLLCDM